MQPIKPEIQLVIGNERNSIYFSNLRMRYRGNSYQLHASTKDTIYIYEQGIVLYVLTINRDNWTIGLNSYMQPEPSPINSFYMHNGKDIKHIFGPKWKQVSPETFIEKLLDYLI